MTTEISQQKRLVAGLLCFFLAWLGAHRFYVRKVGTGILFIVTFAGFCGIWASVDLIPILVGSFKDGEGRVLRQWV